MARNFRLGLAAMFAVATLGLAPAAGAQPGPDFGDDTSRWARDGECDDPRFMGEGMSEGVSLDDDIGHDASDCRSAWRDGEITLVDEDNIATPDFGDDASDWALDDECDDPRFGGPGMTETKLLDEDIGHDASDCSAAWESGGLWLKGDDGASTPDFGDDDGEWSEDGECDDPRFTGEGMTKTKLLQEDSLHDATDCRAAWDAGTIELR